MSLPPNAKRKTEEIELELLLEGLYEKYGYDFRRYSRASLKRRIDQAKDRLGCSTLSELQNKILHSSQDFETFLSYLTIQVSEMFRDPSYYMALRCKVIPHLRTYPSIKIWIAGCSAGEELYSFAILLREEGLENRCIFYATDINQTALLKAEAGVYRPEDILQFTKNYQLAGGKASFSDYYTAAYGSVVIDKSLKKKAVFSDHSLVTDSVFSEVHLISCRNVLIYFERALQDRAVGLFKDSLVRKGFLGLGSKETLRFSEHKEAFETFDRDERIYQRRGPA